jgi:hypothetical protein
VFIRLQFVTLKEQAAATTNLSHINVVYICLVTREHELTYRVLFIR